MMKLIIFKYFSLFFVNFDKKHPYNIINTQYPLFQHP